MNSKKIGNNFERECSYILSEWLTGDNKELVIWRSASSGAVATNRRKKGIKENKNLDGDFTCLDEKYQWFLDTFYIDSKSYKEFNSFIINTKNIKSNLIFQQYVKLVEECPLNKKPFLICKIRDRKTPAFVMSRGDICLDSNYNQNKMSYNIHYKKKDYNINIILLEDFLKISPDYLLKNNS